MYVEVSEHRAEIRDADNCRSLDLRVVAGDRSQVDAALRAAALGNWDGGAEAELSVEGLRAAAAAGDVGADWAGRWDAMIGYAAAKGWLTEDGAAVRAHLVDLD